MLTVTLTNDQWSIIVQLLDKVQGMENAKVLLPIYEAIKEAANAARSSNGAVRGASGEPDMVFDATAVPDTATHS